MTLPVLDTTLDSGMKVAIANLATSITGLAVDKPTALAENEHVLLIFQSAAQVPLNISVGSGQTGVDGFREIYNNTDGGYTDRIYTWAAIKKAGASEPAQYSLTFPANTGDATLHAFRLTNLDPTFTFVMGQGITNSSVTGLTTYAQKVPEDDTLELSIMGSTRANTLQNPGVNKPTGMNLVYNKATRNNANGIGVGLAFLQNATKGDRAARTWGSYISTAGRATAVTLHFRGRRTKGNRWFFGYSSRNLLGYTTPGATTLEYTYSYGNLSTLEPLILPSSHTVGPNQRLAAAYVYSAAQTNGVAGNNKIAAYNANASTGDIENLLEAWDVAINPANSTAPVWAGMELSRPLLREEGTILKPVGGIGGTSSTGRNAKVGVFPVASGVGKRLQGGFDDNYPDPADSTVILPMYFVVEDIADPTLVEVNNGSDIVRYGSRATMRALNFTGGVNNVTIAGIDVTEFDADGFTPLPLVGGLVVPAPGTVTAIATSATESSALEIEMAAPVNHNLIQLSGTLNSSEESAIYNFNPAAKETDWVVFPTHVMVDGVLTPTNTSMLPDGSYETTLVGAQKCYLLENLGNGFARVRTFALINGVVGVAPIITDVNGGSIVMGPGTATLSVANFGPLTSVTIDGVPVTGLAGSNGNYTFNKPLLNGVQKIPGAGTVTVSVTDGTNTKTTLVNVIPPANIDVFTLVASKNTEGHIGFLIPSAANDQILMATPASLGIVNNRIAMNGGAIQTDRTQPQTVYHRSHVDGTVTALVLNPYAGGTDLSLESAEQLFALLMRDNEVPELLITEVDFGVPTVIATTKNTSLVLSSKSGSRYSGNVTLTYNRLQLSGFSQYGEPNLIVGASATLADVIAAFNAHYNSALAINDDISSSLVVPEPTNEGVEFDLVALAGSIAYIGSITLNLAMATTPLSSIIVTTDFDGLEFPELIQ